MPKGIPKWVDKLSAMELHHIRKVAGCLTFVQIKKTFKQHMHWRVAKPEPQDEPCWDCWAIHQKLGLADTTLHIKVKLHRTGAISVDNVRWGPSTSVARFLRSKIIGCN